MLTNTQKRHLDRALNIAKESTCRQKHGVVIAQGKKVLAVAVNTQRNHPNNVSDPKTQATYHAEWNAMRQLKTIDMSKVSLYSARILHTGESALAKPCKFCQHLIDFYDIKNVYYTE